MVFVTCWTKSKLQLSATCVAILYAVATVLVVGNAGDHLRQVVHLQNELRDAEMSDEVFLKLVG